MIKEKLLAKIAKLEARSALSEDQQLKLAKLKRKQAAAALADVSAARAKPPATATQTTDEPTDAAFVPRAARWSRKKEDWVYPEDTTLKCAECAVGFPFSGTEQAWYAKQKFHAPTRCAACVAAKKARFESREEKKRAGVSGQGRCFNCGASGHLSSECPEAKREGKGCYTCGSADHLSRNCPEAARGPKKAKKCCYNCGDSGHVTASCPKPKARRDPNRGLPAGSAESRADLSWNAAPDSPSRYVSTAGRATTRSATAPSRCAFRASASPFVTASVRGRIANSTTRGGPGPGPS
jgi:hypothetical protein